MRTYAACIGKPVTDNLGAAIVVLMEEGPDRFALVKEGDREPSYWKFSGGKVEPEDGSPLDAAIREAKEETGITIPPERIRQIGIIRKPTHEVFVFAALVKSFAGIAKRGEEGEIVSVFSLQDLEWMERDKEFLPAHSIIKKMFFAFVNG